MPEIPRTKFNSPWTVAVIEAALNDVSSAKGSSESLTAALNAMRAEINSLSGGVHLKGAVDYYADLPASPSEGDAYTVRYQETSGADPLGIEYAWATYQGTPQWIPIGVDPAVFAKATDEAEDRAALVELVDSGAKNVLYYTKVGTSVESGSQYISNGVCFTLQSDGSILVNRESSNANDAFCNLRLDNSSQFIDDYCNGQYVLSGTHDDCIVRATNNSYNAVDTAGNGVVLQDRGAQTSIWVQLRVAASASPNNVTVKPMICTKAEWDISNASAPYARTNPELTVLTGEDRAALVELVDGGAKNRANITQEGIKSANTSATWNGNTTTFRGVTFTANADGTVTVQASANTRANDATLFLMPSVDAFDMAGMMLSGCPSGGDNTRFELQTVANSVRDYGSGAKITASGNNRIAIVVRGTYTDTTPIVFRPMICTTAAWKISQAYQPYRPSWQEMYDMILALQSGGNRALMMQTEPEEQEER